MQPWRPERPVTSSQRRPGPDAGFLHEILRKQESTFRKLSIKTMRGLVILFFLLAQAYPAMTQQQAGQEFLHYTKQEGLSHDNVSGVAQDKTGYIWLSTSMGLNRFNGSNFVQFHTTTDSLSLPSGDLKGMTWLDPYRLAVFTTGLHIVDTRTGKTKNLFIPYHDMRHQYKFNTVMSARGGHSGDVYLLTRSGFYHFDSSYNLVFRFDYYKDKEVAASYFFFGNVFGGDLYAFDQNRLLIISTGGLYLYDTRNREFKKMKAADSPLLAEFLDYPSTYYSFLQPAPGRFLILKSESDSAVYVDQAKNQKVVTRLPFPQLGKEFHFRTRLIPDNDSIFYITSHSSGFYKIQVSPKTGKIGLSEKYFPAYLCNDILKDRGNNLWIATNKGLFQQHAGREQVEVSYIPTGITDSIPIITLDDIYLKGENIYAGPRGYAGVLIFDKKTFQYRRTVKFNTNAGNVDLVTALVPADNNNLLLGTTPIYMLQFSSNRLTKIDVDSWHREDWPSEIYRTRNGEIWMSGEEIHRYDPAAGKFILQPVKVPNKILRSNAFCEDKEGNIWMAGQGLIRYNTHTRAVDRILDSLPYIKIPDNRIDAIVMDAQQRIWFGSNNNGLAYYDTQNGSFRQFTRGDGLPENNIASLIIVGNKLWIACFTGIACLDLRTMEITRFGKEDGFPDLPVNKAAKFFYDSLTQQLYIPFSKAIARFNPHKMVQKKRPPIVFIENIQVNAKQDYYLPGYTLSTSWKDKDIRVTIGSIHYWGGPSPLFAYRIMDEPEAPWQELGSQPAFSISKLSPGRHRIQVKAFSPNNSWPEQVREMSITVLPPFWRTNWFIFLAFMVILTLVYLLIAWRISMVRRKEMEKTHNQKLKADFYKNQYELEQISNYFSSSLANKKTEEEVLWDVSNNLIGRMNYEHCVIYLWNENKTKMLQKAAFGPKGDPVSISTQKFDVLPGQGVVGYVMQTHRPVLVSDTRTDKRYRVDDAFRLSEACVPIFHNGELLGVIDSEHTKPNYYTDRDIKILTTIATLLGNKLKQIESEQTLQVKQLELVSINEQLAEAQLSALQAQMNPHFVFNALNSIKRMILDGDNKRASRYLSKFALMIRMTLDHSRDVFVTLGENIDYLKSYLEMEQLRFDDSFTYDISCDENIDTGEILIPSMMMQPLVENAIWHGLLQVEGPKKISIRFTRCKERINCHIEDNGIGIRASEKLKESQRGSHKSVGLGNLHKRIKILNEKYDTDCRLEITDLGEKGTGRGTHVNLSFNVMNI